MGAKHAKTSGLPADGGDTSKVQPSDWYADHLGVGKVLLEEHIASSSTSLDFTTRNKAGHSGATFQSDFDEYLLEMVNLLPATSDVGLRMRMSTNGGSSFDTSAIYGWGAWVYRAGGGGATGAEGGATFSQLTYGSGGTVGINTSANWGGVSGHLRIFDPQSAIFKTTEGFIRYFDVEPFRLGNDIFGSYESTTAVNAFQLYMSSGNIVSGVARLYGIGKS